MFFSQACKTVRASRETGMPPSPQKPGGVYIPARIEEEVADLVRALRRRMMPVFVDDVMAWMTEKIDGTSYAENFSDGKANENWYYEFLRRQGMLTDTERPLETTREEWLTEENLLKYYEIAAKIMVKAGVAELRPDYDPDVPFCEQLTIGRSH